MRWLSIGILLTAPAAPALAQGTKVTFRADHTVLVDGQPFFPIGLYYCAEAFEDDSNRLLKELKELGVNTLGYYRWGTPGWQRELERAGRLGFKVWVRGVNGFALDSPAVERAAAEQVRQTRAYPALLFWEFQDEPLLNKVSVEGSRKGYRLLKREDPDHPLLTVEWPGAIHRLREWQGIGDAFGVDLYPIPRQRKYGRLPNHDVTQIRDYMAAIRAAHGDVPVVMVLQAWAWEPLKDGVKGYPTPRESRFMAYQAVIHGVSGIFYYGQVHCTKPNPAASLYSPAKDPAVQKVEFEKCLELNRRFWKGHRPFFRELAKVRSIFVLPAAKPAKQIRLERQQIGAGIESCTRQGGEHLYLFAVNPGLQEAKATFRLPAGTRADEVHVLFEGRKLAVTDGTFFDAFGPYGTHVYATTPDLPR